jgi:hypothetical protein
VWNAGNRPRRIVVGPASFIQPTESEDMSSIPTNAMPHAGPSPEAGTEADAGSGVTLKERAGKLATSATEFARENPKTAVAAGAALFAGAVAAAAIPAVRARKNGSSKSSSGSSGGSSSVSRKKKS